MQDQHNLGRPSWVEVSKMDRESRAALRPMVQLLQDLCDIMLSKIYKDYIDGISS